MTPLHSLPPEVGWSFYGTRRFTRHSILLVDDEPAVLDLLGGKLGEAGFQVLTAWNVNSALARVRAAAPSLIVIDWNLSHLSGVELCRQLKSEPSTNLIPIIILSAKASEEDRILGFELGADDFVAKPFNPREMILRIENSLRRAEPERPAEIKMTLNGLVLDPIRHEVTIEKELIHLNRIEFRLLTLLMERCGSLLDRKTLVAEVWGQPGGKVTRTVDTSVTRLRRKLGSWSRHVESVRGVGYRLNEAPPSLVKDHRRLQIERDAAPYFLERLHRGPVVKSVMPRRRANRPGLHAHVLVGAGED